MSDHQPARRETSFVYAHPVLIAALVGIAITGIFLFALYQGMQGHHPEGGHGPAADHGAPPPGTPGAASSAAAQ
jgi:hypothetical protein